MADAQKPNLIETLLATAWAELLNHPVATISALVVIATAFVGFTKKGRDLVKGILCRIVSKVRPLVPRETIRIVPNSHERWWHMGKSNNKPAMQVVTKLHVTNITEKPVKLLSVRIKPTNTVGHVLTRHPEENIYGSYPILPSDTVPVSVDFFIEPPIKKEGTDLNAKIILIDQYGNSHKSQKIVFISDKKTRQKKEEQPPEEKLSAIRDPLEKQLVAILKDEVNRYKGCGRRTGGLGSVQTRYKDHVYPGVPTDSRQANSPRQQSIVEDPENSFIESDNIIAFSQVLDKANDEVKSTISSLLAKRISRSSEYAPIGYFFLLAFLGLGQLQLVLKVSKKNLQGDKKYGFSDLLRMLDGLLKYQHQNFSDDDLDSIEQFLDGINEHTFRISERLVAIRSYRLSRIN